MAYKFNTPGLVKLILTLLISGWIIISFLEYVPFYLPSYLIWGGIFIGILSGFCLILPLKKIGFTRKRAVMIGGAALIVAGTAFLWPPSISTVDRVQRLDDFLPRYQCVEYHEVRSDVPADKLTAAIPLIRMADLPGADLLFRLRYLVSDEAYVPDPAPLLDTDSGNGFFVLDISNPAERVYGLVGQPWTESIPDDVKTAEDFKAFDKPGHIRVAFNFRVMDQGREGSLISTETRCLGNDAMARKILARYWRVIYPGSSIIRRVWLNAVIDRAREL